MLEKFSQHFHLTDQSVVFEDNKHHYKGIPASLFSFLEMFGGMTFNNGLYRVHTFRSSIVWSSIISEYFIDYQSEIYPFGFDWMGRQFCMSTKDENLIFMFDPATHEDFELSQNVISFHDVDLVEDTTNMLSDDLFNEALKANLLTDIKHNECLSLNIPMFLGGEDIIENYRKSDLEVYWHIQSQIYKKIKDLPDGTKIGSIKFE